MRFAARVRSRHPVSAVLLAAVLIGTAGCKKAPTGPDVTLTVNDLTVGTGATVVTGSLVTLTYSAWLFDASKLDDKGVLVQTTDGASPFTQRVGIGAMIAGFDLGLPGMKVGGVRRLIVPPELAYGAVGSPPLIPPNATLVFDITLLNAQ